jgi:hypothetical protein
MNKKSRHFDKRCRLFYINVSTHLRTELIKNIFAQFIKSSLWITRSLIFPVSNKCALNVPASNPQEMGGANNSPSFSATRLPIVNSVISSFSLYNSTSSIRAALIMWRGFAECNHSSLLFNRTSFFWIRDAS